MFWTFPCLCGEGESTSMRLTLFDKNAACPLSPVTRHKNVSLLNLLINAYNGSVHIHLTLTCMLVIRTWTAFSHAHTSYYPSVPFIHIPISLPQRHALSGVCVFCKFIPTNRALHLTQRIMFK